MLSFASSLVISQSSPSSSTNYSMEFHTLSPPNSEAFSDNVISSVVQSTWAAHSKKEHVEQMSLYKQQPQRHAHRQAPYMRATVEPQTISPEIYPNARDDVTPALASLINLIGRTSSPTGRRTVLPSDLKTANQIISTIQAANHPITAELQDAVVMEALKKKIQHRERCRVNQARYRQRQLKVKNDIQDEIAKLQVEITELELRYQDPSRLPTTPMVWVLAADYFRHFRQFLSSPATQQATAASFLREMLAPDVVGASPSGVEAQIENWRLFALYFRDADLDLKGLSMPTPDTLVANTSTTVAITSNTLRLAFPHLNSDGNGGDRGGVWSPLAVRMLEQKLVIRGSVVFGWDNLSDQVVRLQTRADMLTPMLKLLGCLDDVSCVFENAMITPECQFVRRQ